MLEFNYNKEFGWLQWLSGEFGLFSHDKMFQMSLDILVARNNRLNTFESYILSIEQS